MADRKAFLEYMFLFNPDDAWSSLSSFEKDLADFFAANGYEANVIKTVDGQMGRRILDIVKIDPMSLETNHHNQPKLPPPDQKSVKRHMVTPTGGYYQTKKEIK